MPSIENAHALVVGIANYWYINHLPSTVVKDAQDVCDLLSASQYCGYLPSKVHKLLDKQATQAAFRTSLVDLAKQSDMDSSVFIYLSSHGGRIEAGPYAGEYLLPVDSVYTSEKSLAQTAISGAEFTALLRAIPARKIVVVFDCCHSGGIGQPKNVAAAALKTGLSESYYDSLKAGRGRVILASSRSTEYSYVMEGAENSLFTEHLLNGLRGGIASEDGFIKIFDLFEYLQPRVTAAHKNQHPIFKAELEENFPIALYLGGQKGVIQQKDEDGFRYDAYVSYADQEPDATWVWNTLVPALEQGGLRIAVSGDVETPGVDRVVNIERGIKQAKRAILVLSKDYLANTMAEFENVLAQTIGIKQGTYRLLPIEIEPIEETHLPARISQLSTLDFTRPSHSKEHQLQRLVRALRDPLPRMEASMR